uniref:Muellerian-inhibiting factor n=1 Tax=Sphenodon punctatus TaxID=8508 RepID=A0A8D0H8K3_SPHPU
MKTKLEVVVRCLMLLHASMALPRIEAPVEESLSPEKEQERAEVGGLSWVELRSKAAMLLSSSEDDSKGAKLYQFVEEGNPRPRSDSSLHHHPFGLEEPVCRVKIIGRRPGLGQSHLETVGVLTSYESNFIKAVRESSWDAGDLETFGICPADVTHAAAALLPLKRIEAHLAKPEENRFLVLHLEEVRWEAQTKLWFKLALQEDVRRSLGELQSALLVFYPGKGKRKGTKPREKFLLGGEGLHSKQTLCLSRDTRYLVLRASVAAGIHLHGQQLSFEVSLAIWHHGDRGSAIPSPEAQELLFGFDEKCFTRMTPVLLLLVEQRREEDSLPVSSFLSVDGVVELAAYPWPSHPSLSGSWTEVPPSDSATAHANASALGPGHTAQFLESLTRFAGRLLNPSGEPPSTSRPHHWLDVETMETLPHWLLNLSETVALEQLVLSEEPLVLLFPENSQALLEQHFGHWQLEGRLLQLLLEKLQAVVQELREIPVFQANQGLFQHLLALCYYPAGFPPGQAGSVSRETAQGKMRTLLLLKVLQTVRARWREQRKASRQNRSTGAQAYCRLQELEIDLRYEKFIISPESYLANNCEGPCRGPLSSRVPDFYSHTLLLLGMQERGTLLARPPCCVPVKYSDIVIISFSNTGGVQVRKFRNMVAEQCGCR